MSKSVLSDLLSEKHGLSKSKAKDIVDDLFAGIETTLLSQGSITFVGFGTFYVKEDKARTGRNPATGNPVEIPAKKSVKFRAGAPLKARVNG